MSRSHHRRVLLAVTIAPAALLVSGQAFAATAAIPAPKTAANATAAAAKVNINTSTSKQLQTVKGIGPKMAKEIIEYRPYKDFTKLEQKLTKYFPLKAIKAVEPSLSF